MAAGAGSLVTVIAISRASTFWRRASCLASSASCFSASRAAICSRLLFGMTETKATRTWCGIRAAARSGRSAALANW